MNQEAIRKMRLAHKYQKEAIMELVPEEFRGNITTIEKEMKEIGIKCITKVGLDLMKTFMSETPQETEKEQTAQSEKVQKIKID